MSHQTTVDELWNAESGGGSVFSPAQIADLPDAAQRYLNHAIAPGTRLASAVRLKMQGEIKLRGWLPFSAEQVIRQERGFIWRAATHFFGLPIRGSDRFLDGEGAMLWKIFGLFPVMTASGADITRSAIGRYQVETIWLPSLLCRPDVTWTQTDALHPRARFATHGETTDLKLITDDTGQLRTASLNRWGQKDGEAFKDGKSFGYRPFSGIFDAETTFEGYTIPTRLRVGWDCPDSTGAWDGEFFRATITEAVFR